MAQGFVASVGDNSTFSEAVLISFDPEKISLETLVDIHLHTHKSTSDHSMRKKYRSAVYTFFDQQKMEVSSILKRLQDNFEQPLITQVLPFIEFKPSPERFENYYRKNPQKPFCKNYISPKLEVLLTNYRKEIDPEKLRL